MEHEYIAQFLNMENTECNICITTYNRSKHAKITCDYCQYSACRECYQRYLIDTTETAHCMNCKKAWNRKILVDKFTQSFINKDYKEHMKELLFEKERALLPATQAVVEEIKIKNVHKKRIKEIKQQIDALYAELDECEGA